MGTSALGIAGPGQSLQRLRRTYREYTDQHGRVFGAQADIASSQPIGELMPQGFTPPWLPPMRFAKFVRDGDLRFRWDYETMANELAGDTTTYYQSAITFALEHSKPEPEVGGVVHPTIVMVLGKPPLSPAIPLAAQGGDPWILGTPGAPVNEALKAVLLQGVGSTNRAALDLIRAALKLKMDGMQTVPEVPVPQPVAERVKTIDDVDVTTMPEITYREFVAQYAGRGVKLPEIAKAWQEHKALWAASV